MARPTLCRLEKYWKRVSTVLSTIATRGFPANFLRCLDEQFADQEIELHLVISNYGTWLASDATIAFALRAAFHSDQFQLAQPSGAVV